MDGRDVRNRTRMRGDTDGTSRVADKLTKWTDGQPNGDRHRLSAAWRSGYRRRDRHSRVECVSGSIGRRAMDAGKRDDGVGGQYTRVEHEQQHSRIKHEQHARIEHEWRRTHEHDRSVDSRDSG
jgi:hypothetical protein